MKLNECIQDALKTGNHKEFVKMLLKKKPWPEKNFSEEFYMIVENHMNKNGVDQCDKKEMANYLAGFCVVTPAYWNSCICDMTDDTGRYKLQTIRQWVNGEKVPTREAIIQYCLWMCISLDECNKLLRLAGQSALYNLNLYDITTILYLKENEQKNQLSEQEFLQIRKEHCDIASMLPQAEEMKKRGEIKVSAYDQKILEHLAIAMEEFKSSSKQENISNSQLYLTRYVGNKIEEENLTTKNLKDFVSDNLSLFGEIHFGIVERLNRYVDTEKYYLKNLYQYRGSFLPKDSGRILENAARTRELLPQIASKLEGNRHVKNVAVTSLLSATNEDLEYGDPIERRDGAFTDLNVILYGRLESDVNKVKVYRYSHPSKIVLLRLLIALGREDEIGTMLIRGGYWEKDWTAAYKDEENVKLDWSDYLIVYLIRYRDELLNYWAKENGKTPVTYSNLNRPIFPFHKMTLEFSYLIYQDISSKGKNIMHKDKLKKYLLMVSSDSE